MKTNRFRFIYLVGISLATALTVSCGKGGWLDNMGKELTGQLTAITQSNLLQNSRLGFMSNAEGVPSGDVDVITDVQISGSALPGGSTAITVTSSKKLKELYLQIEGEDNSYYIWELEPEDQISTNPWTYYIVLEFGQTLGEGEEHLAESQRTFIISGKTIDDDIVEPKEEELKTINAETGALQINLSWDLDDDLDLHVYSPSQQHIYYSHPEAGNARLDVDANAACSYAKRNLRINSENIYFEEPLEDGDYLVVVKLYEKCESSRPGARYNVVANLKGKFITVNKAKQSGKFGDTENSVNDNIIGTINVANESNGRYTCTNCSN
jgi:hypothetical protein